jgi:1-deoxy-D-xylulose-5-phosphate synthase
MEDIYPLLSTIDCPDDLRRLRVEQLPQLCKELRGFMIDCLSKNPGHFASSLGVVELTVALHYVFDTPYDRIVWDVGHQAYAHKILTGRRGRFGTNRKMGGLRPFPTPLESEYDTFTSGHASNSISAALGMAVAAQRKGEDGRHVVAVIGDGAMSGGLAFEGLNNVSSTPNNMLIILNDNGMSIDKSVGGMRQYLRHLHTSTAYNRLRFRLSRQLVKLGFLNESRRKTLIRFNNSIKSLLANQQNIFEGLNIRYFGPMYGHDVVELVRTLSEIKDMKGPKLLHIHTVKGKGFRPAELEAAAWHYPGRFDRDTGRFIKEDNCDAGPKYQDVFGETLLELARGNARIVGVTPAMPTGCSMCIMQKAMPERVFDVGIAEGHAVTFSAGMAKDGLFPFCNIYSSFAQRAYDNIIHDAAILGVDMCLCLDRAGLVGRDGPTHHGAFDLAYLRPVPHVTVSSPYDESELRNLMYTAQLPGHGVFVIRYPRGNGNNPDWRTPMHEIKVGTGRTMREGKDVALLTLGPLGQVAAQAAREVAESGCGIAPAHFDMRFLKPVDTEILDLVGANFKRVITVEDGVTKGGLASEVAEYFASRGYSPQLVVLGLPDEFVEHGSPAELYRLVGLDKETIVSEITKPLP